MEYDTTTAALHFQMGTLASLPFFPSISSVSHMSMASLQPQAVVKVLEG